MNVIISDEQWVNSCKRGHKLTNSSNWREFGWKLKIRYFRTPQITSKWNNTSRQCWRGCGMIGDHTHIFWDCPIISNYWQNVQKEINTCFQIGIPLEPLYFILGVLPDDLAENDETDLLRTLLLIANKVITSLWLQPHPPTIAQWKERIQEVYNIESLTAFLHLKTEAFIWKWTRVVLHFHLI